MSFFVPLPGPRESYVDIVDGSSTAVQRAIRRDGLAGYEPSTIAAFLALNELQAPGFGFFDVGANIGLYSVLCAAIFDPGDVVAFEPTPGTARIARKIERVNRLGVRVEEVALGRDPGTADLFLSAKSDASNSMVEGFKESVGTVEVEVRRLDDVVAESGLTPSLMKIDAETFEPEIIAGAQATLAEHRPHVIVEVLNRGGHDHGIEMTAAFAGLGYRFHEISPYAEWVECETITGNADGVHCDWLLSPDPLPHDFGDRFERWEAALAECTADRNRTTRVATTGASPGPTLRRVASKLGRRVERLLS